MRRSALAPTVLFALLAPFACTTSNDTPNPTGADASVDGGGDPIDGLASSGTLQVPGLTASVRVVRDTHGMLHIYAQNEADAFRAQGYLTARDRAPQLEVFRRLAEGRLASIFGNLDASVGAQDVYFRALGLRRTAEAYYASLAPNSEAKLIVDAYAAGITAYFQGIRDKSINYPAVWALLPRAQFLDWDGPASLALARLQTWNLSWDADLELENTAVIDAMKSTFTATSTNPAYAARVQLVADMMRFDPPALTPVVPMPPAGATATASKPKIVPRKPLPKDVVARTKQAFSAPALARQMLGHRGNVGSNNWVLSPSKSATGKSMVGSDPHLALRAPSLFHMVAIHIADADPRKAMDVAGMSFAGIPGVVLGFNKNIAWGATVAYFDVNDLYDDKISADGHVMVGGKSVAIVPISETIDYGDGSGPQPITIETIPGHGVIFPDTKNNRWTPRTATEVVSYRWTGLEPSGEFEAFMNLARAANVDEAKTALTPFLVGAQNFVIGDSSGDILYTTHSRVPVRPKAALAWDPKTLSGTIPCLVQPGDQSLEWIGDVPDSLLPQAKNPSTNYIATANADQYGLTFDNDPTNDPVYLGCYWDPGFRNARVHERIEAKATLSLDDMAAIQADAKSPLGARLAKYLVAAIQRAEDAKSGKTPAPDLAAVIADARYSSATMQQVMSILNAWDAAGYDTPAAVSVTGDPDPTSADIASSEATCVFNATLVPLFKYVFDDEWQAMGSPTWEKDVTMRMLVRILDNKSTLVNVDAKGDSVVWDDLTTPSVTETKDERMIRALLDGLDFLNKTFGADPSTWRWGQIHNVRFSTVLTGTDATLSIPRSSDAKFPFGGFPRHGDEHIVDAAHYGLGGSDYSFAFTYGEGPNQRFVASLDAAAPTVRNALPGGNVWLPTDPHFQDEAQLWRLNQNAPVPFVEVDVAAAAESRTDLTP
ncbi:MAG: penicillin acylase family protein [Polyangiales bacterium]